MSKLFFAMIVILTIYFAVLIIASICSIFINLRKRARIKTVVSGQISLTVKENNIEKLVLHPLENSVEVEKDVSSKIRRR